MVTTQHQRDEPVAAFDDQCLDRLVGTCACQLAQVLDGLYARRRDFREFLLCRLAFAVGRQRGRSLYVRGVIVVVTVGDRVLARVGQYVEFLRAAAADLAAVCVDDAKFKAEALEDGRVRRDQYRRSRRPS